jgi:hypothetical protein
MHLFPFQVYLFQTLEMWNENNSEKENRERSKGMRNDTEMMSLWFERTQKWQIKI